MVTDAQTSIERPLRFVVFGGSIASDWNNPVATSARAILSSIAKAGHEVTFLEQRGNPALAGLLASRGSRGFTAFGYRYPEIQFRTYDLPRGWERTVWFGREIATADAVLALPGMPEALLPEIAALDSYRIVRLVDESFDIEYTDLTLVRAAGDQSPETIAFGPAVDESASDSTDRHIDLMLVAYDDPDAAESARSQLESFNLVLIQTGTAVLSGWEYVPEVELPNWYAVSRVAVVTGEGESRWSDARRDLPLASGCRTRAIDPISIADALSRPSAAELPRAIGAGGQANGLIVAVRREFARNRPA